MTTKFLFTFKTLALASALVFSLPSHARFQLQGEGSEQGGVRGNTQGLHLGAIFHRLDTNADGFVSLDEMTAGTLVRTLKRFEKLDADEDGLVSLEEFTAIKKVREDDFAEYGDALKTCVEEALETTLPEHVNIEERFSQHDANQDGSVDIDEANAHAAANVEGRFNALDANADGLLTREELKVGLEIRKERRQAVRQCVQSLQEQNDTLDDLGSDELKAVAL